MTTQARWKDGQINYYHQKEINAPAPQQKRQSEIEKLEKSAPVLRKRQAPQQEELATKSKKKVIAPEAPYVDKSQKLTPTKQALKLTSPAKKAPVVVDNESQSSDNYSVDRSSAPKKRDLKAQSKVSDQKNGNIKNLAHQKRVDSKPSAFDDAFKKQLMDMMRKINTNLVKLNTTMEKQTKMSTAASSEAEVVPRRSTRQKSQV